MTMQWCCFKCKQEMEKAQLWMSYLDFERQMEGIRCPKCGAAYLLEETVVKVVMGLEAALEAK